MRHFYSNPPIIYRVLPDKQDGGIIMPFVEITSGTGALTTEQKIKLNKTVSKSIKDVYEAEKGFRPNVWVVLREHDPNNILVNEETLTEVRKKRETEK
jgi:phenylpyruvate tautomerase PptA (4-oxalocrotonate tautomerase family)